MTQKLLKPKIAFINILLDLSTKIRLILKFGKEKTNLAKFISILLQKVILQLSSIVSRVEMFSH